MTFTVSIMRATYTARARLSWTGGVALDEGQGVKPWFGARTLAPPRPSFHLSQRVTERYDNSSAEMPFRPLAALENERLTLAADPLPSWAREALHDYI